MMSEKVAEGWLDLDEDQTDSETRMVRDRVFDDIRDSLLEFTARGFFTQSVQGNNHQKVYQKMQEVFQLDRLYREVSDEVELIYNCLQQQRIERFNQLQESQREQTKKLEHRLSEIAMLLGGPALGLAVQEALGLTGLGITIGILSVSFLLGWIGLRVIKKRD
jgi:hypothetical protein